MIHPDSTEQKQASIDEETSGNTEIAQSTSTNQATKILPILGDTAPYLLEALALGAASLYIAHNPSRKALKQRVRSWWKSLIGTPVALAGEKHQRVLSLFVIPDGTDSAKLMLAKINADCIDLLVEQPLQLPSESTDNWSDLTLEPAIQSVLSALRDLEHDPYTLALIDPALQEESRLIQPLAQCQQDLLHPRLMNSLSQLNQADQQLLRQWLNNPSGTDVTVSSGCLAVMHELARSQQHWAQFMPERMANVAGVLELSIAITSLSPNNSVI